jgi:kynureninase
MRTVELDRNDPLASFRERFVIEPEPIYLDGNSLGRLPRRTVEVMRDVVERQWGSQLIRSWNDGWREAPRRIGDKIGRLIGALPGEVVACDTTSVNFYKLAHAVLATTDRRRIVTDRANFPSDVYLLQGLAAQFPGTTITLLGSETGDTSAEEVEAALGEDVALLTLSHVGFRTGQLHDLARLAAAAHRAGALVLWDLSHSAGVVPVEVEANGADLAVGCSYKYLNGGPGGSAYLYVRTEHQERLRSPIWGWFGQRNAFDFGLDYTPGEGIDRFMAGSPAILSLSAVEPGVDLLLEAGIERIRAKSVAMTSLMIELVDARLHAYGFRVITPRDPNARGSHVTLAHPEAWRINQALIQEEKLIPDFRAPDGLRIGFVPLYNTFAEVEEAVLRIARVMETRAYERYGAERPAVT